MFTVIQHGRFTDTKRTGIPTLPKAIAEAESFIAAATTESVERLRLLALVLTAAGTGEPVELPNGKTLELDCIED